MVQEIPGKIITPPMLVLLVLCMPLGQVLPADAFDSCQGILSPLLQGLYGLVGVQLPFQHCTLTEKIELRFPGKTDLSLKQKSEHTLTKHF